MKPESDQTSSSKPAVSAGVTRRSFIGKAAVTAPVLAAFVSKPSWSIDGNCINSGSMSGNLSNHACQAVARNATWWTNNINLWDNNQIEGISPQTRFYDVFGAKALAYHTKRGVYYKDLNADGSVQSMLALPRSTTIGEVLAGISKNKKIATAVDKAIISSYLNLLHPGISYSGYSDVASLLTAYNTAIVNYMTTKDNLIFDDMHNAIEGTNGLNENKDVS